MIRQPTLYYLHHVYPFPFIETYFMAQNMACLVNALCALNNNDHSVTIRWSSKNINQIGLVNNVLQVFYVLIDFLSLLSIIDKGVLKFLIIVMNCLFFLVILVFSSYILEFCHWIYTFRIFWPLDKLVPLLLWNYLLCPW